MESIYQLSRFLVKGLHCDKVHVKFRKIHLPLKFLRQICDIRTNRTNALRKRDVPTFS